MSDFLRSCMWQLFYNYCKCAIKVTTMLQLSTMYIHVIMLRVHIFTNHYGIHLQLFFIMILIDTINLAINGPLLKY
jgi:hypothetical protein